MQKSFRFLLLGSCILFTSCNQSKNSIPLENANSSDSVNIFPVTSFFKAQLKALDTLPVTPLQIITAEGRMDSSWLKREDIRKEATAFLSPRIDSLNMHSLFTEKSFLDQTINAYTFSYDPKTQLPDSIDLRHWDVYMNPQTNTVERIYLVKERDSTDKSIITQLTWVVNKWYSIRTITQYPGKEPLVKEKKMIWNFDD